MGSGESVVEAVKHRAVATRAVADQLAPRYAPAPAEFTTLVAAHSKSSSLRWGFMSAPEMVRFLGEAWADYRQRL
jgi:hypothetical protein